MEITKEVFENFIVCPYKAYRTIRKETGNKTEYEVMHRELADLYVTNALNKHFRDRTKTPEILPQDSAFNDGQHILHQKQISHHELSSCCTVERVPENFGTGTFSYMPVLFTPKEKLSKNDKLLITFDSLILSGLQAHLPQYGKIIHGKNYKTTKVKIENQCNRVKTILGDIKRKLCVAEGSPPQLILNRHCQICEFKDECRTMAIKDENLSLLGQIGAKEILKKNKKGIFTLTQLSYTFRPRRRRKRPDGYRRPHSVALRAMAIRDKKVYVYGTPILPKKATEIYFDVEGTEDDGFVYLAGLVVFENERIEEYSFWANTHEEEVDIFIKCLNIIKRYEDYVLYHYGSYELAYLKRMKKMNVVAAQEIDMIMARSFNLLGVFFDNVYVPTYTNGLKEIGQYLGFQWSDTNASGIQSIVWRNKWKMTRLEEYKARLIQYNLEDCHALLRVKSFFSCIIERKVGDKDDKSGEAIFVDDLKRKSIFKFCIGEFALPEFGVLNKCAHFDYQRERVHVRTSAYLQKYYSKAIVVKNRKDYRPNTMVPSPKKEPCPLCGRVVKKTFKPLFKKIVDLKFSKSGVKRWVTQLNAYLFYCLRCKKAFIPQWYKSIGKKYGHNLMAWTMYRHVIGGQSFRQIAADSRELFGIHMEKSNAHLFKSYIMEYYQETFESIGRKILASPILYVDETPINMRFESGYAWVMTNAEEVVSFYRPTRDGDFIKKYLADYREILVSDFYNAYDSLNCLQQKCLLHLIRDFNDDLLKNPFDEEFKDMAKKFTSVLQDIVATIDKRGLKKWHLDKHNKPVVKFFEDVLSRDYNSETARQYQKRLTKNRDKLFLFLNHDNVSWNNNTVEHAIKLLATHKNKNLTFFRESRMDEYLKIMSIYQTCKYKGVSYLKFMLSREKDIDGYCREILRKRRIIPMLG